MNRSSWTVSFTKKASKLVPKLPKRERDLLVALVGDLKLRGPVLPDWPNYSKLGKGNYHCHLSYKWVACWTVEDNEVRMIELYYVGSRENAPY
ncbi:MAG: cytotoxic translational repressor of toxin-antitoxin stability system [Alphaproteobacteria bacterium]|nr:cytotoxic translational repressor of toxin-antitoxin stability system [Alphaproteobacteria bacterium]